MGAGEERREGGRERARERERKREERKKGGEKERERKQARGGPGEGDVPLLARVGWGSAWSVL